MRSALQLLGGVAVAGIVATGGSALAVGGNALTGQGLTNSAGATQYVGGSATMTVNGVTLNSIAYAMDAGKNGIATITVNVTDANGKTPTVSVSGGTWGAGSAGTITCTSVGSASATNSTCTVYQSDGNTADYVHSFTSITVSVV